MKKVQKVIKIHQCPYRDIKLNYSTLSFLLIGYGYLGDIPSSYGPTKVPSGRGGLIHQIGGGKSCRKNNDKAVITVLGFYMRKLWDTIR